MTQKWFWLIFTCFTFNYFVNSSEEYVELSLNLYTPEYLLELLLQTENQFELQSKYSNLLIKINDFTASSNSIGNTLDKFLTPRPWWYVLQEPYHWNEIKNQPIEIKLGYVGDVYTPTLKQYASIQYPSDCSKFPLQTHKTEGFDSFGNNFYNYNVLHLVFKSSIVLPFIVDKETLSTSFLSHHYCPHIENKFQCAFLPPTTCLQPSPELVMLNKSYYYKTSTSEPTPITEDKVNELNKLASKLNPTWLEDKIPYTTYTKFSGLFREGKHNTNTERYDHKMSLFTYAILFRLNYSFRSQVFHEIHQFKSSLSSPFPSGNCISVHIRRNKDRAPYQLRGKQILEWCEKYKIQSDGSCWDDDAKAYLQKGDCVHYYDYGCSTANPYGSLTLENYLNATNILSSTIQNIYLRTDDDLFVSEELKTYVGNKKIFYFPASHEHRKGSTSSGVSYMAAIELARECNGGFVGHSASAVTNLFMSLLCIRHSGNFGKCPTFFDFAT